MSRVSSSVIISPHKKNRPLAARSPTTSVLNYGAVSNAIRRASRVARVNAWALMVSIASSSAVRVRSGIVKQANPPHPLFQGWRRGVDRYTKTDRAVARISLACSAWCAEPCVVAPLSIPCTGRNLVVAKRRLAYFPLLRSEPRAWARARSSRFRYRIGRRRTGP